MLNIFRSFILRGPNFQEGKMSYKEFVWFLLAEVDKKHPTRYDSHFVFHFTYTNPVKSMCPYVIVTVISRRPC